MMVAYFGYEWLFLALFTVFGIPLVLLVLLWVLDRAGYMPKKHIPGKCDTCGYDLTGNVSGICPECGESLPGNTEEG